MKPRPDQPRKLVAYTKGYAAGFNGVDVETNPFAHLHGNFQRGFEDAWREGWVDGWNAGKHVRKEARV